MKLKNMLTNFKIGFYDLSVGLRCGLGCFCGRVRSLILVWRQCGPTCLLMSSGWPGREID